MMTAKFHFCEGWELERLLHILEERALSICIRMQLLNELGPRPGELGQFIQDGESLVAELLNIGWQAREVKAIKAASIRLDNIVWLQGVARHG